MSRPGYRRGLGLVEVVVVVALLGILFLVLLIAVPRGRESARKASCQRNLMQIGFALGLYHQSTNRLPTARLGGQGPLASILEELGAADFMGLDARKAGPTPGPGSPPAGRPVRGFVCPSDPDATAGLHRAPISYRATTGDTVDGRGGPFQPGRTVTLPEVEAADGASFTAAFSERMVGTGRPVEGPNNYQVVARMSDAPIASPAGNPHWVGDAGSSWLGSNWRSTLANHSEPPGHSPTWIRDDGLASNMGASSGHPDGVHVLMLDGSLKTTRPTIDPAVWRALATVGEPPR